MPRADEFAGQVSNPVKKYLTWDSDNQCFKFYDKAAGKNVHVPLPIKIVFLKEMATIKGYNDSEGSGIYSNEVPIFKLKEKELTVKMFNKKTIATGLYANIKGDIASAGGKFAVNMYAMVNGELVSITLVGSSFSAWFDFNESNRTFISKNYILVNSAEEKKKGKTIYSQPIFTLGEAIEEKDGLIGDNLYDELSAFMSSKGNSRDEAHSAAEIIADARQEEQSSLPKLPNAPEQDSELPF